MKNKVLIISGTNIISGAEFVLNDYIKETDNKKNIYILTSNKENVCSFYKKLLKEQVFCSKYLSQLGAKKNKNIFFIYKKIIYFIKYFFILKKILLKHQDIEIIYANNTGDIIYSLYAYIFRKKFVINIHDSLENDKILQRIVNIFKKFVDFYIVDSKSIKIKLLKMGIYDKNIKVLYTGLTYKAFLEKKISNPFVFGWIGILDDRKNPLEFIEILNFFKKYGINLKAKMVYKIVENNNDLEYKIKKKIKEYNLEVELINGLDRKDLDSFYQSLTILILTSRSEALPTVILEALNNSIPVISHNIDGVPEIIKNNKNGYLYSSFEDINKITKILINMNNEKYYQLSLEANRIIKKKFNLNYKITNLDKIIFQL